MKHQLESHGYTPGAHLGLILAWLIWLPPTPALPLQVEAGEVVRAATAGSMEFLILGVLVAFVGLAGWLAWGTWQDRNRLGTSVRGSRSGTGDALTEDGDQVEAVRIDSIEDLPRLIQNLPAMWRDGIVDEETRPFWRLISPRIDGDQVRLRLEAINKQDPSPGIDLRTEAAIAKDSSPGADKWLFSNLLHIASWKHVAYPGPERSWSDSDFWPRVIACSLELAGRCFDLGEEVKTVFVDVAIEQPIKKVISNRFGETTKVRGVQSLCVFSIAFERAVFEENIDELKRVALDNYADLIDKVSLFPNRVAKFEDERSFVPIASIEPITVDAIQEWIPPTHGALAVRSVELHERSPGEFEELIGALMRSMGLDVTVTGRTGDGGIDLEAIDPRPLMGGRILVQCKRYAPGNNVGVTEVRELLGVVTKERALKGILVTTSDFTNPAREAADGERVDLIDGAGLRRLLLEHHLVD